MMAGRQITEVGWELLLSPSSTPLLFLPSPSRSLLSSSNQLPTSVPLPRGGETEGLGDSSSSFTTGATTSFIFLTFSSSFMALLISFIFLFLSCSTCSSVSSSLWLRSLLGLLGAVVLPRVVPRDVPRVVPREVPREVPRLVPREVPRQVPRCMPREASAEMHNEAGAEARAEGCALRCRGKC